MMKKLPVVLLITALLMWSCGGTPANKADMSDSGKSVEENSGITNKSVSKTSNQSKTEAAALPPPITAQRSLNNIDQKVVESWTENFEMGDFYTNRPPSQYSVWFSKDFFNEVYNLLSSEGANVASPVAGKTPDGFRIYLLTDISSTVPALALVSTKFNGTEGNRNKHIDYYEHDINHKLFKSPVAQQGTPCLDNCDGGARLYGDCTGTGCDVICPPTGTTARQAVPRRYAQTMAGHKGRLAYNTKSVWFSFAMLKKMQGTLPFTYDGVRIYLTNYSLKDHLGKPNPSEKSNRYTFLLTATQKNASSVNEDIFDCYPFKNLWKQKDDDPDGGINNGELCPNHCNVDDESLTFAARNKNK